MDFNAQSLAKSRRNSFENSTSRGTREVRVRTSLFFVPPSRRVCYPPPKSPSCEGDLFLLELCKSGTSLFSYPEQKSVSHTGLFLGKEEVGIGVYLGRGLAR